MKNIGLFLFLVSDVLIQLIREINIFLFQDHMLKKDKRFFVLQVYSFQMRSLMYKKSFAEEELKVLQFGIYIFFLIW